MTGVDIRDSPRDRAVGSRAMVPIAGAWRLGRTKIGVLLTSAMVFVAIAGPTLAPHGLEDIVAVPFAPSAPGAPLGTDYLGHDVITHVLYGGRSILWEAFAAATLGVGAGIAWGVAAGCSRTWLDNTFMRIADVVYAIPLIVLVLVVLSVAPSSEALIVLLIAVAWAPQVARIARGLTKDVVNREFVEACRLIGVPRRRIVLREILPNAATPLLVEYGLRLTWAIAAIAAISFLGFGRQPPATDWGLMINQNRQGLTTAPWGTLLPCACIALFTIGTNLIADGLGRSVARVDDPAG